MNPIEELLKDAEDLPTLPTIYTSLLDVMSNPRSSVNDVAIIITQDIAASTKIIKTVNSPIYSLKAKVETITDSIFHLGFEEVKNLVISLSVMNLFKSDSTFQTFSIIDLWKHSIGVGVITRLIGIEIGVKNIENYFLAGLIHDIGKLFFADVFKDDYKQVIRYSEENEKSIEEAEDAVFGVNHTLAGEALARTWGLPDSFVNSIRYHSSGFAGDEPNLLTACVHVSNILARALEMGYAGDDYVHKPNPEVWDVLKLKDDSIAKSYKKFIENYNQAVSILLQT